MITKNLTIKKISIEFEKPKNQMMVKLKENSNSMDYLK
jgi:hypothetical protein